MAELALGILGLAIEVGGWVAAPIKRRFSYLFCFTSNVAALIVEAKKLNFQTMLLQERVNRDKNVGREQIYELVEDWLTASGDATRTKERIMAEATEVESGFSNYRKRVSLSKEAMETAEAMKELIQTCKFESVTLPLSVAEIHALNYRKRVREETFIRQCMILGSLIYELTLR